MERLRQSLADAARDETKKKVEKAKALREVMVRKKKVERGW